MATLFFTYDSLSQGTVMIVGIDTEFGSRPSNNSHGSIADWANVINTGLLANVSNGQNGILVIGGGKDSSNNVKEFWNQVASLLGRSATYKHRRSLFNIISEIDTVDFNSYALIAVATDHSDVTGRLDPRESAALNRRKKDVAEFLCRGGALFASSCELGNAFEYVAHFGSVGTFSKEYTDITPTPDGSSVGITNTNLDNGPWHIAFSSFPPYLKPLAHNRSNAIAAIGGKNVSIGHPEFALVKFIFCPDEEIIADASSTNGAVNHFWSVQESDADWNVSGPEISQWFENGPSTRNISTFAAAKDFRFKCNSYYRIKLAVTSLCGVWSETSKLIRISCANVTAGVDRCVSCSMDGTGTQLGQGNLANIFLSYTWSPAAGLDNPNVASPVHSNGSVSYPITYKVSVSDSMGCSNADQVTLWCKQPFLKLSKTLGCCNISLNSNAENYSTLTWSNGSSDVTSIDVSAAGTYAVTASNACGSVTETITVTGVDASLVGELADIIAPDGFSPDGDGRNDYFQLIHFGPTAPAIGSGPAYNATDYRLTIFDDGGVPHIVAEGYAVCPGFSNGEIKWDGKINNTIVQTGIYNYLLEMKNCRFKDEWKIPKIYHPRYKCVSCRFSLFNWSCGAFSRCTKSELINELEPSATGHVTVYRP